MPASAGVRRSEPAPPGPDTSGPHDAPSQLGEQILAGAVSAAYVPERFRANLPNPREGLNTMVKAILFKQFHRSLSSGFDVSRRLRRYPYIADKFGFNSVPSRSTFNRVERGLAETEGFGAARALAVRKIENLRSSGCKEARAALRSVVSEEPPSNPSTISMAKKREAVHHMRELVFGDIDFNRKYNTSYSSGRLLNLQAEIAREKGFYSRLFDETDPAHGDEPVPSPNAYFGALQADRNEHHPPTQPEGARHWQQQFRQVYDKQIEAIKRAGMLDRPVDLYIDATVVPYFKRNVDPPDGVVGGHSQRGTMYGWKFATVDAQCGGRSISIATIPLPESGNLGPAVKDLVEQAQRFVSVDCVHMDSEFLKRETLDWLMQRDIDFVVPKPRVGKRFKKAVATVSGTFGTVESYRMGVDSSANPEIEVALAVEPDYDEFEGTPPWERESVTGVHEWGDLYEVDLEAADELLWKARRAYATSITDQNAEAIIRRYKQRWTIETSYRVAKEEFLARTCTRSHPARVFYWNFALMLYNAWILTGIFLQLDHPEEAPEDRPPIAAATFTKAFFSSPETD